MTGKFIEKSGEKIFLTTRECRMIEILKSVDDVIKTSYGVVKESGDIYPYSWSEFSFVDDIKEVLEELRSTK